MSITIIFGGQYGSEGKGKVAHYFAIQQNAKYCVRVGGPNSGHTVYKNGTKMIFRMLPTGIIEPTVKAVLPAGSYVDIDILRSEIKASGITTDRLLIDENAYVVTNVHKSSEINNRLMEKIGSTTSGTGAAVIDRIMRKNDLLLAKNCEELKNCIIDTKSVLRQACCKDEKIVIEGTQGFGLSLLHSREYPYVTSRDTSAAGFLSETGLSPFDVENIVMVIRAFPIRVSGNSGPLKNEISWDILKKELGCERDLTEFTSCTNRIRRVARFDPELVKNSIVANRPNTIVLNHLDYVAEANRIRFIADIEQAIGQKINYMGNNPISILKI